jgi:hypothetical protein
MASITFQCPDLIERNAKIFEDKNFKLLGFVEKNKITRECLMGQVEIVVPQQNDKSKD